MNAGGKKSTTYTMPIPLPARVTGWMVVPPTVTGMAREILGPEGEDEEDRSSPGELEIT